jgi:N-acetylmuramoyl-L-alanine amidase
VFAWRPRTKTTRLIVHSSHMAASVPNHCAAMRARGREMGLLEVGYHFVIERDGSLVETRPRGSVGAHTPGNNHNSIGVCLAGDAASRHTVEQRVMLHALVVDLMWQFGRLEVVGHTELQRYRNRELRCPHLDMDELRETLMHITQDIPDKAPAAAEPEDKLTPQQRLILDYLGAGRTLTTKVAVTSLGIMSVSSRIAELRKMGHPILEREARDHFGKRYLKYFVEQPAEAVA